jgi:hypothetical protein
MGKMMQAMNSLRSRMTPSKSTSSVDRSAVSLVSSPSSSASSNEARVSTPRMRTQPSAALFGLLTPPTTAVEFLLLEKEREVRQHPSAKHIAQGGPQNSVESNENISTRRVSTYTDLAVNAAMLRFAKKLPLEELSMIGHGLESLSPKEKVTDYSPNDDATYGQREMPAPHPLHPLHSPWSFVHRSDSTDEQRSCSPELPRSSSPTLTLSSTISTSPWSFACRSARRAEREHAGHNESDDESTCGSLDGWGVSSTLEQQDEASDTGEFFEHASQYSNLIDPSPGSREHKHDSCKSDEEFDALPEWSDVEDESEYNEPFKRDSDAWSVTSAGSSNGGADAFVVAAMHLSTGCSGSRTRKRRGAVFAGAKTTRVPDESSEEESPVKCLKLMVGWKTLRRRGTRSNVR